MGPNEVMAQQSAELRATVNVEQAISAPPPEAKKVFPTAGERLRQKLLGSPAREHWIDVPNPDTGEVDRCLLMAPSVRQGNALINKAITLPKGKDVDELDASSVTVDNAELQVSALILCLRDPETKKPILTTADHDALMDGELNYLVAALGVKAAQLCNPNAKSAKKNS
jgi:hypothetical protein